MSRYEAVELKQQIQDAWRRAPESRIDYPTLVSMTEAIRRVAVREGLIPGQEPASTVPDRSTS